MRHISSCIPKSKLGHSNMIATATRQHGDVFFTAMLIIEDGAISDIGLHGPFGTCTEGHKFSYAWTGRNEDDLNAGRAVASPTTTASQPRRASTWCVASRARSSTARTFAAMNRSSINVAQIRTASRRPDRGGRGA